MHVVGKIETRCWDAKGQPRMKLKRAVLVQALGFWYSISRTVHGKA